MLHQNGAIHLHDLEGYRHVYNCCSPALNSILDKNTFVAHSDFGLIAEIFEKLKILISNLAVCQTGGIGFVNFDGDIADTLERLTIRYNDANHEAMREVVRMFMYWINNSKTRYCREPYYLSLNIGLAVSVWGRAVAQCVIETFFEMKMENTRPNIIFKVKSDINSNGNSVNYDLFQLALKCTAKKMIPTYLLMDSSVNKSCVSEQLGIMGCRTRVYQNVNAPEGTVGRGNVAYISINLPRLALISKNLQDFEKNLKQRILECKDVLLNRIKELFHSKDLDFVLKNHIWSNVRSIQDLVQQGTLSIGFIGLSETVEILCGKKFHLSTEAEQLGFHIVSQLRKYIDQFRQETNMNFSLLATPGEMISGKFAETDKSIYGHATAQKEFYTNSFHAEVDSSLSLLEKIHLEGKFHSLCNGGCISYVEFRDAPMDNTEALEDLIHYATDQGVSYLGFNFPLDICLDCNTCGTFDYCTQCNSGNIKRIRRVSGYLEDLNYFTRGKEREVKQRRANC